MNFLPKKMGTIVNLSACPESRPFTPKYVVLPAGCKIVLGRASGQGERVASPSNGWFPPLDDSGRETGGGLGDSEDLPLSPAHAELWAENGHVYIRDLGSKHGTYVNDVRITGPSPLKTDDILILGFELPRSASTPRHLTSHDLKPIVAKVHVVGDTSK